MECKNGSPGVRPEAGLRVRGASLRHNLEYAVCDVDLELSPGEIHALVGSDNSAKSALCSLAAGEVAPTSGNLVAWGKPLPVMSRADMMAYGIIKAPKIPQLFPHLTVAQNLVAGVSGGWRQKLGSWRAEFRRLAAWLGGHGIELAASLPLQFIPRDQWLFIQILNLLYRRPRLFILDETLELLPPEQRNQVWPLLLEQAGEGMMVMWATQSLDDAMVFADGISVFHERRLLVANRTGDLDRLSLVRLCYRRLTEGEESTLEQFHHMLCFTEAALRDLPTAVFVVDTDNQIRFANRSACVQFDAAEAEFLRAPLSRFATPGHEQLVQMIQVAIEEAEETGEEVYWHSQPFASKRGNRLADIRIRPIGDGGQRVGFMVIIEDVSVREDLRRQLVLSENMASVGLLAAGVAHEVNNPLAIISNYNRYLRGKIAGEGPEEAVRQIEAQTQIIKDIVRSLNAFTDSRVAGTCPIELHRFADGLCRLVSADSRSRDIVIRCSPPDSGEAVKVLANPDEMRLVVLNLLRNAMDSLQGGKGTITVKIAATRNAEGRFAKLAVTDTGRGISLPDPNQVFLPFVSTKIPGETHHQGIGLSIAHKIVSKHRGTILAENIPEGGCRFTVSLPLWENGAEATG